MARFDTYIALSPSLWWNAQALVRGADERLRTQPNVGDDDIGDACKGLAAALPATKPAP